MPLATSVLALLPGDVLAPVGDRPDAHLDQPEQRLQHRRLAGAVGSDDADQLALRQLEAAAVEDVHLRHVAGDDVVDVDQEVVDVIGRASSSSSAVGT